MSLESISKQLNDKNNNLPPVEQWDPPYCGEMDLTIKADGQWFYNGSVISRERLVRLFSTVIKKQNNDYFLVTPVEKLKIRVEHKPFVITHWQWLENISPKTIELTSNVGDKVLLGAENPLIFDDDNTLQVNIRRNLYASIHRNVFYQWAEIASIVETKEGSQLTLTSADHKHSLGFV